jgi:hypothetical protein
MIMLSFPFVVSFIRLFVSCSFVQQCRQWPSLLKDIPVPFHVEPIHVRGVSLAQGVP